MGNSIVHRECMNYAAAGRFMQKKRAVFRTYPGRGKIRENAASRSASMRAAGR